MKQQTVIAPKVGRGEVEVQPVMGIAISAMYLPIFKMGQVV